MTLTREIDHERQLEKCDSAASSHRHGLLQRSGLWKLVAFDNAFGPQPLRPGAWSGHPEWMSLAELELCLGLGDEVALRR